MSSYQDGFNDSFWNRHVQSWLVHPIITSVWYHIICRNIWSGLVLIATLTFGTLHQPWGDTAWPLAPFFQVFFRVFWGLFGDWFVHTYTTWLQLMVPTPPMELGLSYPIYTVGVFQCIVETLLPLPGASLTRKATMGGLPLKSGAKNEIPHLTIHVKKPNIMSSILEVVTYLYNYQAPFCTKNDVPWMVKPW